MLKARLTPFVRFLLWDYERGSLAYDVAVVVVLLTMLLVPGGFLGDPLWGPR
jgi:hypothetical protein